MKNIILIFSAIFFGGACYAKPAISNNQVAGSFPIVSGKTATPLYVDPADYEVVKLAAGWFQQDVEKVAGIRPLLLNKKSAEKNIIIIGSIDRSQLISELISTKKLQAANLKTKWEGFQISIVKKPFPGIEKALVIVGSDRRGTAYGILEISRQIGVSPWYYWADVPVQQKKEVYYTGGTITDAPAVKYRGIFIND